MSEPQAAEPYAASGRRISNFLRIAAAMTPSMAIGNRGFLRINWSIMCPVYITTGGIFRISRILALRPGRQVGEQLRLPARAREISETAGGETCRTRIVGGRLCLIAKDQRCFAERGLKPVVARCGRVACARPQRSRTSAAIPRRAFKVALQHRDGGGVDAGVARQPRPPRPAGLLRTPGNKS